MAKKYDVTYTIGADDQTAAGLQSAIKNLTSPIERIQKQWTGFVRASGINAYIELAQKGFRAIQFAGEQYAIFLEQKDRELAFQSLAERAGSNAQTIVRELKSASNQLLTTQAAIDSASRAFLMGLEPDTIVRLMRVAVSASRVTGQSVTAAFGDITLGVARQSKMILDNLGIILDYDKHLKLVADSARKTVSQLTDLERRQAFLNATFEAGEKNIQKVGNNVNALSERYKQAKTSIADSAIEIKNSLLSISTPAVVQSLETTASLLEKIKNAMKLPTGQQTPEQMLAQPRTLLRTKPMGEGSRARAPWELGVDEIKREQEELAAIDWGKWAENYAKTVDRSAAAILLSMDNLDKRLQEDVVVNGQSLEKLVDNAARAFEEGMRQQEEAAREAQERMRDTIGFRLGESLAEGFTYSAQRGISDGIFTMITEGRLDARSIFKTFGMSMARVFADAFAEALTAPLKSLFASLFGSFLNIGVSAGVTGLTGGSATGSGIPGLQIGNGSGLYGMPKTSITNNYYIQDDAMLEKRIDAAMKKSMRTNQFRQELKATK